MLTLKSLHAQPGFMEDHLGAMEAHPVLVEVYLGAVEPHPVALEAHPGALESGVLETNKIKFRFEPNQTETRSVSRLFRFVS